jgi:hypothetical protein
MTAGPRSRGCHDLPAARTASASPAVRTTIAISSRDGGGCARARRKSAPTGSSPRRTRSCWSCPLDRHHPNVYGHPRAWLSALPPRLPARRTRHPDIHSTHSVLTAEDVPRRPARTRRTAAPSSRSVAVRTWWSRADADAPPSGRGKQQRALCGSVRPRPRRTDAGGRARKGRSDLASGSVRIPRTSTASDMSWDVFGLLGTSRDECLLIACFSAP